MRRGEKGILLGILVIPVVFILINDYRKSNDTTPDKGIPFFSTATAEMKKEAGALISQLGCRDCHSLWGFRNIMQSVPSPPLDGIGSLRSEGWLYDYLSAVDPKQILPSRLKPEYQMPSYAHLSVDDRTLLAGYLASLKVEDWYLEEAKKREYEKLTGKDYVGSNVHE